MEAKLFNGDYIPDGLGGVVRCEGADALLERVLYLLGREPAAQRSTAAMQYAAEALADEDVSVTDVTLSPAGEGRVQLTVLLEHRGEGLSVAMTV